MLLTDKSPWKRVEFTCDNGSCDVTKNKTTMEHTYVGVMPPPSFSVSFFKKTAHISTE